MVNSRGVVDNYALRSHWRENEEAQKQRSSKINYTNCHAAWFLDLNLQLLSRYQVLSVDAEIFYTAQTRNSTQLQIVSLYMRNISLYSLGDDARDTCYGYFKISQKEHNARRRSPVGLPG